MKNLSLFFSFSVISLLYFSFSCAKITRVGIASDEYNSIQGAIKIPKPLDELTKQFNHDTKAEKSSLTKENGNTITGFATDNKAFLENVINPLLVPNIGSLSKKSPTEIINTLALFSYEIYRVYIGENTHEWEFYRWGGDILDLDDPQTEGVRHECKYGLDCSGFATMPYELAVMHGLIKPEDEGAVFSSKGFELFCKKTGTKDKGGTGGTSNRYRVDSADMWNLGREILTIKTGDKITDDIINKLKPGDMILGKGHVGIIVVNNGEKYYLESGNIAVAPKGKILRPAKYALVKFLKEYKAISVRRSLADIK